jgi:hypothetical protein
MLRRPHVRAILLLSHLLQWTGIRLRHAGYALAGYALQPGYHPPLSRPVTKSDSRRMALLSRLWP